MICEIEELPVKISCIERLKKQKSKHVIVLELGGHSWILDGDVRLTDGGHQGQTWQPRQTQGWARLRLCNMQIVHCFIQLEAPAWVGLST